MSQYSSGTSPINVREVFRQNSRYARCQFLTTWELHPPKYIVCHDIDLNQTFVATQGMGTWVEVDPYRIADLLNLMEPQP